MNIKSALSIGALTTLMIFSGTASADNQWWPFEISSVEEGNTEFLEYSPLEKAEKQWNLCALLPHMKDSYFMAVNYGLVKEAQRLGVKLTILQADGYTNLPKQAAQFDDCLNSGAQAILTAPISEAGMSIKFEEGLSRDIPQVIFINPVEETAVTSKVYVDFSKKGEMTGQHLIENSESNQKVVAFPGPQGSGWAESYLSGFKGAIKDSDTTLLDEKFGDAGVPQQLRLIEDTLQTYPDITAIWGGAPAAEAAVGAVEEAGLEDMVSIMSSYENQTMAELVKRGKIMGFATEFPVIQGRMAVDLAIRALEGKEYKGYYSVVPKMVTTDTLDQINLEDVLAPNNWRPVYAVD